MEELSQSFAIAQPEERVKILADAFNCGEAGINLLIETLNDHALTVRVIAYQLLRSMQFQKAQQAIAKGILLNEGDRVYNVYQSGIWFTDESYLLFDASTYTDSELADIDCKVDDTEVEGYEAKLLSTYVSKAIAEYIAESIHQKMSQERHIGEFELEKKNFNFNLEKWCLTNNVPYEDDPNFEYNKLNSYLMKPEKYPLWDKLQEAKYQKFNLAQWCVANNIPYEEDWKFFYSLIENMKATKNYELLGKLWKDAVGSFAFVREKVIKQKTYLK